MRRNLDIAIIGAGIGGLAAAAALRRVGIEARVDEQAERFAPVGAGIQQSPNAMKVHRGLGIEARLRDVAFAPATSLNRDAVTGAVSNEYPLGAAAEARYGAPYLTLHRGDLHAALADIVPAGSLDRGKTLVRIAEWITAESWSTKGDVGELRAAFKDFHADARAVLAAAPEVQVGIFERDPLPSWRRGRVVLLGDACHPMTPYMASGAAMALEDAVVLARCLAQMEDSSLEHVFDAYEATRKPRTSQVQAGSSANTWMRNATDPDLALRLRCLGGAARRRSRGVIGV